MLKKVVTCLIIMDRFSFVEITEKGVVNLLEQCQVEIIIWIYLCVKNII